jgi:hypothetical protein
LAVVASIKLPPFRIKSQNKFLPHDTQRPPKTTKNKWSFHIFLLHQQISEKDGKKLLTNDILGILAGMNGNEIPFKRLFFYS